MAQSRIPRSADYKRATKKLPPFAWRQPICVQCWVDLVLKTGQSVPPGNVEFCCFCRKEIAADDGRYHIRLNPGTVPYPTLRKDDDA